VVQRAGLQEKALLRALSGSPLQKIRCSMCVHLANARHAVSCFSLFVVLGVECRALHVRNKGATTVYTCSPTTGFLIKTVNKG
jgi:hypothetical protein